MRLMIAVCLALGAGAAPGLARAAEPDKSDILVVGEANGEQREKRVRDFVRELTDTPGTQPIARFDRDAVCPAAVGLTGAQDAAVTKRMRRVAMAGRVRLAVPGCRPNALVIFAQDKLKLVRALLREQPAYFIGNEERPVELAKRPGPAVAWYLQDVVDRNGTSVPINDEHGYRILSSVDMPSRIDPTTRPIIVASVIVIEYRALAGLTTMQVGDYAAMRAFAGADPDRLKQSTVPTILTVLEAPMESAIPLSLTDWDLAYLRGFNAISADRFRTQQRREIVKAMARDLEQTSPAGE